MKCECGPESGQNGVPSANALLNLKYLRRPGNFKAPRQRLNNKWNNFEVFQVRNLPETEEISRKSWNSRKTLARNRVRVFPKNFQALISRTFEKFNKKKNQKKQTKKPQKKYGKLKPKNIFRKDLKFDFSRWKFNLFKMEETCAWQLFSMNFLLSDYFIRGRVSFQYTSFYWIINCFNHGLKRSLY